MSTNGQIIPLTTLPTVLDQLDWFQVFGDHSPYEVRDAGYLAYLMQHAPQRYAAVWQLQVWPDDPVLVALRVTLRQRGGYTRDGLLAAIDEVAHRRGEGCHSIYAWNLSEFVRELSRTQLATLAEEADEPPADGLAPPDAFRLNAPVEDVELTKLGRNPPRILAVLASATSALTQDEIADKIRMSRATVGRALTVLRAHGLTEPAVGGGEAITTAGRDLVNGRT